MEKPKVVEFPYGATLRDSPAKLRLLADRIEAGEFGEVSCVALCLMGTTFEAFAWGDGINGDSPSPSAALMFSAAHLRVAQTIEAHGRDE